MSGWGAIVLAGERPGGGVLARALDLPAGVLAPLAGRPCLARVLDTLRDSGSVVTITLCGPARAVVGTVPDLGDLVAAPDVAWREPSSGPAASALAGIDGQPFPLLLTSGDHGLLTPAIVDGFCARAAAVDADLVVGLVPYAAVAEAYPDSKRTLLKFADGARCGSNLFALLRPESARALEFWRSVEADRKRPWRIARRLGVITLIRYLLGRLSADAAFATLSERAGCVIRWVTVDEPRAAVDVDSEADWRLADRILTTEREAGA